MLADEDLQCVVCCCKFSCSKRIPRVLHCNHTFCTPCLERLCKLMGVIKTISCPLCRWITCTRASLTVPETLWVNTEIWEEIVEHEQQELEQQELEQQELEQQQSRKEGSVEDDTESQFIEATDPHPRPSAFTSTLQKVFSCVLRPRPEQQHC